MCVCVLCMNVLHCVVNYKDIPYGIYIIFYSKL